MWLGTLLLNNAWKTLAFQLFLLLISQSAPQANFPGSQPEPFVSKLSVTSHITMRYAQTEVVSRVKNPSNLAREVKFSIFLPDSAFISNFSMVIGDEEHVAKVMEKKDADEEFNNAKQIGIGAGLVSQNQRDSNKFSIAANVKGGEKVVFILKYEELLERRNGKYEHAINIHPEGVIENLKVDVFIDESLPISSIFVPELKKSNELNFSRKSKNKDAVVVWSPGSSTAQISYTLNQEAQRAAGEGGVSGQFLVMYDVDRKGQDSEVQVIDGYFVHFFAPDRLQALPKHVVFVLDISGSMMGEKIVQLKDAMFTILDDMTKDDFFSIIVFSSQVTTWTSDELEKLDKEYLADPIIIHASKHNKNIAIIYINSINAGGGTNINDAMLEGIALAEIATKEELLPLNTKSLVVFLTDGMPSIGERNKPTIRQNVKSRNANSVPIFSLAFGRDSDFNLMREISREADGFAKRIYEGSDAAIQLEEFFNQISSPLISELKFEYLGGFVDNNSLSRAEVNTMFKGGEYVVVGKLNNHISSEEAVLTIVLKGEQRDKKYEKNINICLPPRVLPVNQDGLTSSSSLPLPSLPDNPFDHHLTPVALNCSPPPRYPERSAAQHFMQKLHAFVNIKQLLKKDEEKFNDEESARSKAIRLSLENNFVTELTSLVVVVGQDVIIASLGNTIASNVRMSGRSKVAMSAPPSWSNSRTQQQAQHSVSHYAGSGRGLTRSRSRSGYSRRVSKSSMGGSRSVPMMQGPLRSHGDMRYESSLDMAGLQGPSNSPTLGDVQFDHSNFPTSTIPPGCSGSISLYSKTYNRGHNITILENTHDLDNLLFANQLVSLKVNGSCCWEAFTGTNYTGSSKQFTSSGAFLSTTSVGPLFRRAQSVRKC